MSDRSPRERPRAPREPRRTALTYTGGETWVAGDPKVASALAHALDTAAEPRDRLTHGFHSYPARMHWVTAERALAAFAPDKGHVLDPFCGSGTVLVEARVRGLRASGVDLNPLAVHLARLKSDPLDARTRARIADVASEVRERSEALVRVRANVRAELPREELAWYEPHVLKEMAGLIGEIRAIDDQVVREALLLVFSSLVVKFSRQRSDTAEREVERRVRKGLVSEFFERKAFELSERLSDLEANATGPRPRIVEGDARHLGNLVHAPADLVLTSPPYGGTYDYVAHHARRFAWLGIDPRSFAQGEIGARRRGPDAGRFSREIYGMLRAARSVLKPGGHLIMLMGDAQHGEEVVAADELVGSLAEDVGLVPVAVASQPRGDGRKGPPRAEHLMALRA